MKAGLARRNKNRIHIEWSQTGIPLHFKVFFYLACINHRVTLRMIFLILFKLCFLIRLLHKCKFKNIVRAWRFRRIVLLDFHLVGVTHWLGGHGFRLSGSSVHVWVAVAQEGRITFSLQPRHPGIRYRTNLVFDKQLLKTVNVTLGLRRLQIALRMRL